MDLLDLTWKLIEEFEFLKLAKVTNLATKHNKVKET